MSDQITRRHFLGTSGTAAGVAAFAGGLASAAKAQQVKKEGVSANEKITLGMIGCGGQGNYKLKKFFDCEEIVVTAVCDADANQIKKYATVEVVADKYGKKPDVYSDYRKLLDRKDIDVVLIATPDHWHAINTIAACMAGKDVYIEKPCSHTIAEGRAMVDAARKYNRIVQVGMHQRSSEHFQRVADIIRTGKLGEIGSTRTWKVQNLTPEGIGNPPDGNPPAGLDYDVWLGPAPKREFNPNRLHTTFRWFWDYGCGLVGDWNVHLQDIVHWATDCYAPLKVTSLGGKYLIDDNRDTPDNQTIVYEFQNKNGKKFTQTFCYTYTNNRPQQGSDYGIEFYGTNGTLFCNREIMETFPDTMLIPDPKDASKKLRVEKMDRMKTPGVDKVAHLEHNKNFLKAVKSRKIEDLAVDIEVGHKSAAACHLGNIALKVGRTIQWDGVKEICVNADGTPDKEANALLTKEYREPYTLPKF